MKFSEIEEQAWEQLKPYVDTCLLPVTGLQGAELPWEATRALEKLRDALDGLEIPYRGRVVTYPAMHYWMDENGHAALNRLCERLKHAGYRYVVVVSVLRGIDKALLPSADIVGVMDPDADPGAVKEFHRGIHAQVEALWRSGEKEARGNESGSRV